MGQGNGLLGREGVGVIRKWMKAGVAGVQRVGAGVRRAERGQGSAPGQA